MSRPPPTPPEGPAVRLQRDDGVLILTLDRPAVRNAYDRRMRDDLHEALRLAHEDSGVRVLLVWGEGPDFSAGGDLREFGSAPSPLRARDVRSIRDNWRSWSELPCPSIAAVHGHAAGGGCEMALLCDLVVCTPDATFSLPETGLGLIPGVGGTQTLPRWVGEGRAADMLLTGRPMHGREAAALGLVAALSPRRSLRGRALALAQRIAALDPLVVRAARAAICRGTDLPLSLGRGLERRLHGTIRPRST